MRLPASHFLTIQPFFLLILKKSEIRWKIASKMSFFNEIKETFTYSGLGTHELVRMAGKDIPRSLIQLYLILFLTLVCILEGFLFIKFLSSSLMYSLLSFGILLTYLSAIVIYISLILKSKKIIRLLDYLESVLNTSNVKLFKHCK